MDPGGSDALKRRLAILLAPLVLAASAHAQEAPPDSAPAPAPVVHAAKPHAGRAPLEALVPEIADHPYRLEPGPRPFQNRLAVSPAYGSLGSQRLFALRVAYNPSPWLGYEATLGHNPGESVHAVLHSLNGVVRVPLPGRFQPYGRAGYGMLMVFPGTTVNADPVTKNALTAGGGLEFYIRSDLALRADATYATVFGRQRDHDGVVTYDYLEQTIGLAFYRSIRP